MDSIAPIVELAQRYSPRESVMRACSRFPYRFANLVETLDAF